MFVSLKVVKKWMILELIRSDNKLKSNTNTFFGQMSLYF